MYRKTENGKLNRASAQDTEVEWSCSACSFKNVGAIPSCEMCETPREAQGTATMAQDRSLEVTGEQAGHTDASEGTSWTCSQCSFANVDMLPYCEMCEAPRQELPVWSSGDEEDNEEEETVPQVRALQARAPQAPAPASASQRPCPLCSFLNPMARTACKICEAPLPLSSSSAMRPIWDDNAPEATTAKNDGGVQRSALETAEDDEERRLLLSMGWVPEDELGEDAEGDLEEWEIDAAQESLIRRLQDPTPHEGLRERAQRGFEAWKVENSGRQIEER